jgi:hypothetical protein
LESIRVVTPAFVGPAMSKPNLTGTALGGTYGTFRGRKYACAVAFLADILGDLNDFEMQRLLSCDNFECDKCRMWMVRNR